MTLGELLIKLERLKERHGDKLPVILVGSEDEVIIVGAFDDDGMDCCKYKSLKPTHIYMEG